MSLIFQQVYQKTWTAPLFFIERDFPFQVVGGTNMTFFNTLANLGNMWPDTFFLWFVDVITYKVGYYFNTYVHASILMSPHIFT